MPDALLHPSKADLAPNSVRILHLEDSLSDAELVQAILEDDGLVCEILPVPNQARFESLVDQQIFDLIICDHNIPGYSGFAALRYAREKQPGTPIIMVSGSIDEVQAVESLKNGAIDYILKQKLTRLASAVRRALVEAQSRRIHAAAEERMREQASLLNLTSEAIIVRSLDDKIVSWNKGAEKVFGWPEEDVIGRDFATLLQADSALLADARKALLQTGDWLGEIDARNKAGDNLILFSHCNLLRNADGSPRAILSANIDVTEKKRLETIALRSQRMDSIGALAGGIAHDLNNALAPVLMSADLLRISNDPKTRDQFLDIISTSAKRATGMVKQILGFARGAAGKHGPLMLDSTIREMAKIVRETFPKSIQLEFNLPKNDLWQVQGDATELHQVLLNLCVNSRDAISGGVGKIILTGANVRLAGPEAEKLEAAPGPYVLLSVADTGSGIPTHVLPRIFEPFFTTKSADSGTGLGLSTVAGIVRQNRGYISVKSEIGRGTEFKVYLPAIDAEKEGAAALPVAQPLPSGNGELILIIDDEEAVRELARATLENYGYKVLTAQNGVQGLTTFEQHKNDIRVVLSDTDMPVMDGATAVRGIKHIRPEVPVIMASGSKRDVEYWENAGYQNLTNLGKPYTLEQLLLAVAAILHR